MTQEGDGDLFEIIRNYCLTAIEPCGESVSNSELFRRLAKAMGYTEPELFDDDLTAIRASLPGIDVDELRRVGYVRVPYPDDGRPFGDSIALSTT